MRYEIELTFVNNHLFILIISSFNFHRIAKKRQEFLPQGIYDLAFKRGSRLINKTLYIFVFTASSFDSF
jgi:hypothetical protein